jgi:hypothetical protein
MPRAAIVETIKIAEPRTRKFQVPVVQAFQTVRTPIKKPAAVTGTPNMRPTTLVRNWRRKRDFRLEITEVASFSAGRQAKPSSSQ